MHGPSFDAGGLLITEVVDDGLGPESIAQGKSLGVGPGKVFDRFDYLVKIVSDKTLPEAEQACYFRALDFITGPEKDAALVNLLTGGIE